MVISRYSPTTNHSSSAAASRPCSCNSPPCLPCQLPGTLRGLRGLPCLSWGGRSCPGLGRERTSLCRHVHTCPCRGGWAGAPSVCWGWQRSAVSTHASWSSSQCGCQPQCLGTCYMHAICARVYNCYVCITYVLVYYIAFSCVLHMITYSIYSCI